MDKLTEAEWRLVEEFRRDWPRFCDADTVAPDFEDRMEAAGYIELVPASGTEMEDDMFWAEKFGPDKPTLVWSITEAGRLVLREHQP